MGGSANFFGVAAATHAAARHPGLLPSLLAADLALMGVYLLLLTAAARSPLLRRLYPDDQRDDGGSGGGGGGAPGPESAIAPPLSPALAPPPPPLSPPLSPPRAAAATVASAAVAAAGRAAAAALEALCRVPGSGTIALSIAASTGARALRTCAPRAARAGAAPLGLASQVARLPSPSRCIHAPYTHRTRTTHGTCTHHACTMHALCVHRALAVRALCTQVLFCLFLASVGASARLSELLLAGPAAACFATTVLAAHCAVLLLGALLANRVVGARITAAQLLVASNANVGGVGTAIAMAGAMGWPTLVMPAAVAGTVGYACATAMGVGLHAVLSAAR